MPHREGLEMQCRIVGIRAATRSSTIRQGRCGWPMPLCNPFVYFWWQGWRSGRSGRLGHSPPSKPAGESKRRCQTFRFLHACRSSESSHEIRNSKLDTLDPPPTIASEVDALQGPNVQARMQTRSQLRRPASLRINPSSLGGLIPCPWQTGYCPPRSVDSRTS